MQLSARVIAKLNKQRCCSMWRHLRVFACEGLSRFGARSASISRESACDPLLVVAMTRAWLVAVGFAVLIGVATASDVVQLTSDNFEKKVLQSSDYWLVEFYAVSGLCSLASAVFCMHSRLFV